MRYGGGMKGKVNEALAHGVPVVTTSIGAQGFHPENGVEMIVEDDPESFAFALIDVFNNHEKQVEMGTAGQKLNESLCSPEVVESYLEVMIQDALTIKSSRPVKTRRIAIITISLNLYWNKIIEFFEKVKKKLLNSFTL
jgi:glycosyltransferase involved in cell wall biosynthesis